MVFTGVFGLLDNTRGGNGTPIDDDTISGSPDPEPSKPPETTEPPQPAAADVYSAYHELLTDLIATHGICETAFSGYGLWLVYLIDLDGDGTDEMMVYINNYEIDMRTGYIVYGYDQATNKAALIEDHMDDMVEFYEVTVYRGQDGKLYVRNYNGQSYYYQGDFYTYESGVWTRVLYWDVFLDEDTFEPVHYTINGVENIDPADAEAEFEKYMAEFIYNFDLFNWEADDDKQPENNINEMLEQLAAMSTQ